MFNHIHVYEFSTGRPVVKSFKPNQLEAMKLVLQGVDFIAFLPTGYGKSLIFEMIFYANKRTVIIVSPLDSIITG